MPVTIIRPDKLTHGIGLDIDRVGTLTISFTTKLWPAISIDLDEIAENAKYPYAREVLKQWIGEQREAIAKERIREQAAEAERKRNRPTKYSPAL